MQPGSGDGNDDVALANEQPARQTAIIGLDVLRTVVLQGARMALAGIRVGVAGTLVLTRIMKSLLYEVSPTDVTTFALVALMVLALILAACLVPSLRATRINPIVTLRYE